MSDAARRYLREAGYHDSTVQRGLEGLLRGWEFTAEDVAKGRPQYSYEYPNDAADRTILAELLAVLEGKEREETLVRLGAADSMIRPHLERCDECLCTFGDAPSEYWWCYMKPRTWIE